MKSIRQRISNYPIYLLAFVMLLSVGAHFRTGSLGLSENGNLVFVSIASVTLFAVGCYFFFGRVWLYGLIALFGVGAFLFLILAVLSREVAPRTIGLGVGGCLIVVGELVWALVRDMEFDNPPSERQ